MVTYLIIVVVLMVIELLYFKIADKYNIIDKPNQRSSHTDITIRGGAIIIPVAFVLSWFMGIVSWYLTLAIALVTIVSFIDDVKGLHQVPRLVTHLIASLLIFYATGFLGYSWYIQLMVLILLIGWINAFNFMDGINGIMVLYGLVILGSFYYLSSNEQNKELLMVVMLASLVFAYFNVRKKAKAFAGDVGSVSLAFILGYFMLDLILQTGRWEYILFFSVFGIDSIVTIVYRLKNKENIFEAHRSHLYQYLANELKIPHVVVSLFYAIAQLIINIIVIVGINNGFFSSVVALLFLLVLGFTYLFIRFRVNSLIAAS
jgi:UDP-N-acetylmuramyl pentapeptide phosphotransferase/UDP-N-acetylglucosamine-1-phosphate transferase